MKTRITRYLATAAATVATAATFAAVLPATTPADAATNPYETINIASIGVHAPIYGVGESGATMNIPSNVHELGWLTKSAQFNDVIGTQIVAGHVSDNSDHPGALYNLHNIKIGALIKVTHNGVTHTYKVAQKFTNPRTKDVPISISSTTGAAKLVIVTCADKVTYAGGYFHYEDNLFVVANLVN